MYLLYLDGSGSVKNPSERQFVLAGVAVFERQIYHLISKADSFVSSLGLGDAQSAELHASVMANGNKAPWKGIVRKERLQIIERALKMVNDAHNTVRAFAVVADKQAVQDDPVEYDFEKICSRFNHFLSRIWRNRGDRQRGLVVMDESHYEQALQGLARQFREGGTRWGTLHNMAEVPLFADSAASRLIQVADLLAWAVWRRYEYGDTRYFDLVVGRFDREGGVLHGLVHRKDPQQDCHCPGCLSRSLRSTPSVRASNVV